MTVVGTLAHILCGGDNADITKVMTEDDILKLERIGITTLAKNTLSLARMEHMLAKGKPLRN
jgi:3-hydroxyacyl-CoA dehydrogenase